MPTPPFILQQIQAQHLRSTLLSAQGKINTILNYNSTIYNYLLAKLYQLIKFALLKPIIAQFVKCAVALLSLNVPAQVTESLQKIANVKYTL